MSYPTAGRSPEKHFDHATVQVSVHEVIRYVQQGDPRSPGIKLDRDTVEAFKLVMKAPSVEAAIRAAIGQLTGLLDQMTEGAGQ